MDSFKRLGDAIKRYMKGIYGFDQLGGVLLVAAAVALALAGGGNIFWWIVALLLVGWGCFRAFSQHHEARAAENEKFLALVDKVVTWFKGLFNRADSSGTKAYVTCPYCHKQYALPKGKGTLRATCPHCGEKSVHKV